MAKIFKQERGNSVMETGNAELRAGLTWETANGYLGGLIETCSAYDPVVIGGRLQHDVEQ